jgi:hypothetical protein
MQGYQLQPCPAIADLLNSFGERPHRTAAVAYLRDLELIGFDEYPAAVITG